MALRLTFLYPVSRFSKAVERRADFIAGGAVGNEKIAAEAAAQIARKKHRWDETLDATRIIAAVRSTEALERALASPVRIVYLLFGNPMNIAAMVKAVRDRRPVTGLFARCVCGGVPGELRDCGHHFHQP
jgi:hypothetical protein